ncbi:unnamed protein product [Lactuca virosa]|uniref:Uncharacterized protein n=1 Tax=Lactuca virosa TaxID=75947 RepID=A0AAU9P8Z4_9ASTR|nr:unnamed protein product [Lactuca virosa]
MLDRRQEPKPAHHRATITSSGRRRVVGTISNCNTVAPSDHHRDRGLLLPRFVAASRPPLLRSPLQSVSPTKSSFISPPQVTNSDIGTIRYPPSSRYDLSPSSSSRSAY